MRASAQTLIVLFIANRSSNVKRYQDNKIGKGLCQECIMEAFQLRRTFSKVWEENANRIVNRCYSLINLQI